MFLYVTRPALSTQIVPLAAVPSVLKKRWREPKIHGQLAQRYRRGVLGELYGRAVETRIANGLEDLLAWIDQDGATPRTIDDANFVAQLSTRCAPA
jgi:hypothetical protein